MSTEEQGRSGLGLDAQRQAIRSRYAEAEVVTKVQSAGSLRSRPVLRGVLDALVRGDVLAVSKVDRLARSASDFEAIVKRSRRDGWALVCLDLGLDTSTPMGWAMAQMVSVFAELERNRNSERVVDALDARAPAMATRRADIRRLLGEGLSHRAKKWGARRESLLPPREGRGRTFESCRAHGLFKPFFKARNAEKCTIRPLYSASAPAGGGEEPCPEKARGEGLLGFAD